MARATPGLGNEASSGIHGDDRNVVRGGEFQVAPSWLLLRSFISESSTIGSPSGDAAVLRRAEVQDHEIDSVMGMAEQCQCRSAGAVGSTMEPPSSRSDIVVRVMNFGANGLHCRDPEWRAHVGAYGHGPEAELIVGQQIAGEESSSVSTRRITPTFQLNSRGFYRNRSGRRGTCASSTAMTISGRPSGACCAAICRRGRRARGTGRRGRPALCSDGSRTSQHAGQRQHNEQIEGDAPIPQV